jgi:hypothetical protein
MDVYPGLRPPAGSITIEHEGADRRVLCLRGDVDTEVATRFKSSQGRERVAVDAIDAGAVTFISSSGLALMLPASKRPSPPAGTPCCARLLVTSPRPCGWQGSTASSSVRSRTGARTRMQGAPQVAATAATTPREGSAPGDRRPCAVRRCAGACATIGVDRPAACEGEPCPAPRDLRKAR